jgi:excisionase family DNA binding protein
MTSGAILTPVTVTARGWVSVTVAAQRLGYNRSTVRRMIERGELAAHRIGDGDYRISLALINELVGASVEATNAERAKKRSRIIRRGTPPRA